MVLQVVSRTLDVVLLALLVEQQTQTQGSFRLRRPSGVLVGNREHFAEVLDSLGRVAVLALDLGQTLVSKAQLLSANGGRLVILVGGLLLALDADFEEPVQVVNSVFHLALGLVNVSDLLVTLGFLVDVLDLARHIEAFLEVL